jgi:branched-chain amino acid transport system ATP-binding protein
MSSVEPESLPVATAPALGLRGITGGYSDIPIVYDVDLEVGRGQVVAVVGPNGAGKSTLLKAVLGIARLLGGRIELAGKDVTGLPLPQLARLGIGYVPQVDDVFEALRVRENIEP